MNLVRLSILVTVLSIPIFATIVTFPPSQAFFVVPSPCLDTSVPVKTGPTLELTVSLCHDNFWGHTIASVVGDTWQDETCLVIRPAPMYVDDE